jgi:hypothetical protein
MGLNLYRGFDSHRLRQELKMPHTGHFFWQKRSLMISTYIAEMMLHVAQKFFRTYL